jgi:hypothetical protein
VISMPPGPKSKPTCPSDIHYRPTDHQKKFLDSLGPGGAKEKISHILNEAAQRQCPVNKVALESKLLDLTREQKRIGELIGQCTEKLYDLGLSDDEVSEVFSKITIILTQERKD